MLEVQKQIESFLEFGLGSERFIREMDRFCKVVGLNYHFEVHPTKPEPSNNDLFLHLDYSNDGLKESTIVRECRGVVFKITDGKVRLFRFGFERFFNLGEVADADEFIAKSKPCSWIVNEKVDGSIIILSYDESSKEWIAGTRGRVFPEVVIGNGWNGNFSTLFWHVFNETGCKIEELKKGLCYTFELCSPYNHVVIPAEKPNLTLLNIVKIDENDDPIEFNDVYMDIVAREIGVERPRRFKFDGIDELKESLKSENLEREGYVLKIPRKSFPEKNYRFFRAKIKSPVYVQVHNAVANFSLSNLVNLAITGEGDLLSKAGDDKIIKAYRIIRGIIDEKNEELMSFFGTFNGHESRKEFAESVKKLAPFQSFFFGLMDGKWENFWDFLRQTYAGSNKKVRMLIKELDIKSRIMDDRWKIPSEMNDDI